MDKKEHGQGWVIDKVLEMDEDLSSGESFIYQQHKRQTITNSVPSPSFLSWQSHSPTCTQKYLHKKKKREVRSILSPMPFLSQTIKAKYHHYKRKKEHCARLEVAYILTTRRRHNKAPYFTTKKNENNYFIRKVREIENKKPFRTKNCFLCFSFLRTKK